MQKKTMKTDDDLLEVYFRQVKAFPLLSFEEELELSRRIQKGDEAALNRLVNCNLRLVVKIAGMFNVSGIPVLDMIQEGNIGLLHAAKKFDYRKNVRFCTYASWWIRQFISRFVVNGRRLIRLPLRKVDAVYFNQTVDDDSAVDIHEDYTYSPERYLMKQASSDNTMRLLNKLMDRERRIINYRYQLNGCERKTLREIGDKLHISPETVRQIEKRALRKISTHVNELKECIYVEAI